VNFRLRFTLALFGIAAIPLLILGFGVRREMTARLDQDAARRVGSVMATASSSLNDQVIATRVRLASLATELSADNRFRAALADENSAERRWLLDWAPARLRMLGFAVLQVQDSAGRILSSGHFRNAFDRTAPEVPRAVASTPALSAVIDARTPDGSTRALVSMALFTVRGQRYSVIGGASADLERIARLSPDAGVLATLETVGAPLEAGANVAAAFPYVSEADSAATDSARVVLLYNDSATRALKAGVTRWLAITLGGTLLLAFVVATLLGGVISAPVTSLATRAARAEATGELARQVNHDIKNGLAPIRNVLRHLTQTVEKDPAALAEIFTARKGTLDSSVAYLDELARNYAKLSPVMKGGPTDPRPVVLAVAKGSAAPVDVRVPDSLPAIRMGAVELHRILDNLVSNAADALEGKAGTITIGAEALNGAGERRVRFTVTDTGRGMTRDELARAFDDFHTTKPSGTGLGLTVVRRLLTDVGGSVKAETAPGKGSTFTVEIPAA
jgi:signal transduction histidine kinase